MEVSVHFLMVGRDQHWVWCTLSFLGLCLADTWMHATKFFSKMQAHCTFELAPAHFHIEMALSSYLLHKISKDRCLPSPWWGCRARGRRDGCESRAEPGEAAGAAQGPGLSAECGWAVVTFVSRGCPTLVARVVVSPCDLSQGKAFSHGVFVEVSCIQAWRKGEFCPLFILRE